MGVSRKPRQNGETGSTGEVARVQLVIGAPPPRLCRTSGGGSGSLSRRVRWVTPEGPAGLLHLAGVDLHDGVQEAERPLALPLERVAADDGPEAAAVADRAALLEDGLVVLAGGAAGEDHDAAAVERRLNDVAHALAERPDG